MATQTVESILGQSLFSGDPYSNYDKLRQCGPIHWSEELFDGAWVLTSFAGVRSALKDPRLSARRTGGWVMRGSPGGSRQRGRLVDMQRLFARSMVFLDKPAHPRLRRILQTGFRPAEIQKLTGFVRETVICLIDDIEAKFDRTAPFDFIGHFAKVLPARVIARFLGLDGVDQQDFLLWSGRIAAFLGTPRPTPKEVLRARDSIVAMTGFIRRSISAGLYDDQTMLARLVRAQHRREIDSADELLAQFAMLLFAGQETTRHLLGTALYWLLQDSELWGVLREPSRLSPAVRELLRWDSPVQYTGRRAGSSFELFGRSIERNDLVLPIIGAANRDPGVYEHPDRLDLDRKAGLPLSFGTGPHICIGAALTMVEAESALGLLAERWPEACLGSAAEHWIKQPLYRGFTRLMVRQSPGR